MSDYYTCRYCGQSGEIAHKMQKERDSYKSQLEGLNNDRLEMIALAGRYRAELERLRDLVGEKDVEIIDNVLKEGYERINF